MFLMVQAMLANARIDQASRARKQVFTTPQSGGHFRTSYEYIHCARGAPPPPSIHRSAVRDARGSLFAIRSQQVLGRALFVVFNKSFSRELTSKLNETMDTSMESDDIIDADDVDVEPEDIGNVHSDEELDSDSDDECPYISVQSMG